MIQINDFKAEPAALRTAMVEAASRVFESGWYVLGSEVKAFEGAWAEACGVPHCVGVGNGMDAIELALRALDIGPGDEVITTPMTAFATVLAVLRAGVNRCWRTSIRTVACCAQEVCAAASGRRRARSCWYTCTGRCATWTPGRHSRARPACT